MTRPRVAAACTAAEALGIDNLHSTCRGAGPLMLPGVAAPVLPAEECGCGCHQPPTQCTSTTPESSP